MLALVKRYTVEQWAHIDRDHVVEDASAARTWGVLVLSTLILVVLHYFCKSRFIHSLPAVRELFASLPWPKIWSLLYWAGCRVVGYVVLPALVIRFGFRERVADYGLRFERSRPVLLLYLAMFLVVVPLVILVSFSSAFLAKYPFYDNAGQSLPQLLVWELAYAAQFFSLEFFFRGFLLFALARKLGSTAIFVMMVPYVMIHFAKPVPETLGAVITGIALGTLALRTRSIFGGVLIHTAVAWTMDITALWQKGELPWGR